MQTAQHSPLPSRLRANCRGGRHAGRGGRGLHGNTGEVDAAFEAAERRYELPQTGGAFSFLVVLRRARALMSHCPCPNPVPPLEAVRPSALGLGWEGAPRPRVASLALNERKMPSWGPHFKCSGVTHGQRPPCRPHRSGALHYGGKPRRWHQWPRGAVFTMGRVLCCLYVWFE